MAELVNYKDELGKLNPEERTGLVSRWKTYLSGLPREAYERRLTGISRQFGPEFASELVMPELVERKAPTPPTQQVQQELEENPEKQPWTQRAINWVVKQPGVAPVVEKMEGYRKGWVTPAALYATQNFMPRQV